MMNIINPTKPSHRRILLVEDDLDERRMFSRVLGADDRQIVACATGADAMRRAEDTAFDLVVLDLKLPDASGESLMGELRHQSGCRSARFLLTSGVRTAAEDARRCLDAGAGAFVRKGSDPSEFRAAARRLLEDHDTEAAMQSACGGMLAEVGAGLLSHSLDGEILEASDRACELLGRARDDLVGRSVADLRCAGDEPATAAGDEPDADGVVRFRIQSPRPAAPSRVVEVASFRVPQGADFACLAVLQESSPASGRDLELLQAALEAASHSMVITDAAGNVEWVNATFSKVTGYAPAEVIGQHTRMLKSGRHDDAFYQDLWETITDGRVWTGNLTNRRKDGSLYEERVGITPLRDAAGGIRHFIAIKQDLTEQQSIEKRLLRSQRLESIGLLAGGVAHDLNNVLSPLMMATELLKEDLPAEERAELIATLENGCHRGSEIVRQLLTFGRGIGGGHMTLQVRHVLKDICRMARETFPKHLEIELNVPADLWTVSGDATQLHQVLLNLTINARDAMPGGGILRFSAENLELTAPLEFLDQKLAPGRHVCVRVSDTGSGIAEDEITRIFEPFYTTKAEGEGTGLGLSTSLGLVRSHHGLLEVKSTLGRGSVFSLYLPTSDDSMVAAAGAAGEPPRGRGETILLVDDEAPIREIARAILERHGYQVVLAEDGAEGVARFSEMPGKIDLVVTDIKMPIMDGVALIRALRSIQPQLRIMGFSGHVGKEQAIDARIGQAGEFGLRKVLEKPFDARSLLWAVHEALT